MSASRASYLAARREIRERMRSRAFRISTLIQVLAVVAIAVIASATSGGGEKTEVKVGVVGEQGRTVVDRAEGFGRNLGLEFEPIDLPGSRRARAAIADGNIEAMVGSNPVLVSGGIPDEARVVLGQAIADVELRQRLERSGLPEGEARRILDANEVRFATVDAPGDENAGQGIAFISTLLLYVALILCGYAVASGVIEEKSTRVVELVINAIKPRNLLAGKVIGIGLMGLSQLVLSVGAGLGIALALGEVTLPGGTFETVILALVYFVLGFSLYGCAFAVSGSIVSRQEDSQTTTAPVMIILVGSYLLSISATNDPTSSVAVIGTFVPPVAPLIVPARAAAGELPAEQLALSIASMLIGCALLVWLAGRVYERAVLRMGAPVRMRELLKLLRT